MKANIQLPEKFEPLDGERVLARWNANRTQSSRRAVGGRLYLTNRRVLFSPTAFDAAFAGEWWWARLEAIQDVGRQKKDLREVYSGGLRDRLKLVLHDDSTELFVVNKLDKVIEQIRETLNPS